MNDPHVEWLTYNVVCGATLSVKEARPVQYRIARFVLELEQDLLTVSLVDHFASLESAREAVEAYLRHWERDNDLTFGSGALRFHFRDGRIVDRNPPQSGTPQTILAPSVGDLSIVGQDVKVILGRKEYPEPPSGFVATKEVELMWDRLDAYRQGKVGLLEMAYFCLTVLEQSAGSRGAAVSKYSVDRSVLDKLGDLSSARGDSTSARKASGITKALTPEEKGWVEDVVRRLIRRVGEHGAGATLSPLTMKDFRPLP